jgi:uncharacterized protein
LCEECRHCELVAVCGGGYYPHRFSVARGFQNPSIYCFDLTKLIEEIHRRVTAYIEVGSVVSGKRGPAVPVE